MEDSRKKKKKKKQKRLPERKGMPEHKITTTAVKYAGKSILLLMTRICQGYMSDQCELWMHIDCIPVGVDQTPIDSEEQFFVTIVD